MKKINWGTGIAIVITIACIGILFMVYKASTFNFELVTKDYYEKEVTYNQQLNAIANAKGLSDSLKIESQEDFLIIKFPNLDNAPINGSLTLYCVTDASKDIIKDIELDSHGIMLFDQKTLIKSSYKAIASFTSNGKEYYMEQSFLNK